MSKAINRHHTERVINNRVNLVKLIDPIKDWLDYPHRFHKKKPYDCGKPNCTLCHPNKNYDKRSKAKYVYNDDEE